MNKPITQFLVLGLMVIGVDSAYGKTPSPSELKYTSAGLAFQDVDGMSDLGIAIFGGIGKKMPDVHKNFSAEAEVSYSLLDASNNGIDVSVFTLGGYGVYNHHLSGELTAKARAGLVFARSEADCGGLCRGTSDTDIDLSIGLGIIHDYHKNYKLVADWTLVSSEITHVSAGVRYEY